MEIFSIEFKTIKQEETKKVLIRLSDPLKRLFYELESVKNIDELTLQ
ncbi:MAG TPA: hypothetical protein VMU83_22565 [Hanamia sp.]|nr:hypothetical protein [Hanamia sp.]